MAEEDIYGSKKRYERTMSNVPALAKPEEGRAHGSPRRYYCRNPANLKYVHALHAVFEREDRSYIRRNRVLQIFIFIASCTDKDLAECDRGDIDGIVAEIHRQNKTPNSKETVIRTMKWIWRTLFPELDERGRVDERLTPYAVRHVSSSVDRSQRKMRDVRLSLDEYARLVSYFDSDVEMQAYVTVMFESLCRPQELSMRTIGDVELRDNYARIWVSSHGKEGTKGLQCIDSYPYLLKWLERHPHKMNNGAFLFTLDGAADRCLKPNTVRKRLRKACAELGITASVSAYALKHNGVTFRRLRGDADMVIQHVAGWTSADQLRTYDESNAEDALKAQLRRRGIDDGEGSALLATEPRRCTCTRLVGFTEKTCPGCGKVVETIGDGARDEAMAEQALRAVIGAGLANPDRTFAELIRECQDTASSPPRAAHARAAA